MNCTNCGTPLPIRDLCWMCKQKAWELEKRMNCVGISSGCYNGGTLNHLEILEKRLDATEQAAAEQEQRQLFPIKNGLQKNYTNHYCGKIGCLGHNNFFDKCS